MKDLSIEEFEKQLIDLEACEKARQWANGKTLYEAWDTCNYPTWMIWYLRRYIFKYNTAIAINKPSLIELICDIVESFLFLVSEDENRPRTAIETTRKWLKGEATLEEVQQVGKFAHDMFKISCQLYDRSIAYASYVVTAAISLNHTYNILQRVTYAINGVLCFSFEQKAKISICNMIRQKVDIRTI